MNCNLKDVHSMGGGAEVPLNGPPESVPAPYVVPPPNEWVTSKVISLDKAKSV